jgi:hypothetical protein
VDVTALLEVAAQRMHLLAPADKTGSQYLRAAAGERLADVSLSCLRSVDIVLQQRRAERIIRAAVIERELRPAVAQAAELRGAHRRHIPNEGIKKTVAR